MKVFRGWNSLPSLLLKFFFFFYATEEEANNEILNLSSKKAASIGDIPVLGKTTIRDTLFKKWWKPGKIISIKGSN